MALAALISHARRTQASGPLCDLNGVFTLGSHSPLRSLLWGTCAGMLSQSKNSHDSCLHKNSLAFSWVTKTVSGVW